MALPLLAAFAPSSSALPDIVTGKAARKVARPPLLTRMPIYQVMTPLPDGRLVGVIDRTGPNGPEAVARYSADGGRTWTPPEHLFSPPKGTGGWGLHDLVADKNGELHLFYTCDANTAGKGLYEMHFDVYHIGSANGRKTWRKPALVAKGYYGSILSCIVLKSGRIILPLCYLTTRTWSNRGTGFDAYTDMGRFSSGVAYSDDGGDTWKRSPVEFKVPSPYIGADGMIEPIAIERKDGSVLIYQRTQLGRLFQSTSKDGSTWTKMQPTSILSSDSPPSLTRLKDGRIVMLWNHCLRFAYAQGGRHVIHAAISDDDGKSWRGYREVAANPYIDEPPPPSGDHGVAYTLPALTSEGDILTPLSVGGTGGMWLLRLDPNWLDETSSKADFDAGAQQWHSFGTKGVEFVSNPDNPAERVLQIRKPESDWPSAVTWNFPNGTSGRLKIRVKLNTGFGGVRIGLTDHFSVPFDPEESCYNLANLNIGPDGKLNHGEITPGEWHNVQFDWNCAKMECKVSVDGKQVDTLPISRRGCGINYVRFTSTAEDTDRAGMLVDSVEATVTP